MKRKRMKSIRNTKQTTTNDSEQIQIQKDDVDDAIILPLACLTNFRSASLHAVSDLSPVQSKEWEEFQSASAHDVLQVLATSSEVINSYFLDKCMM